MQKVMSWSKTFILMLLLAMLFLAPVPAFAGGGGGGPPPDSNSSQAPIAGMQNANTTSGYDQNNLQTYYSYALENADE